MVAAANKPAAIVAQRAEAIAESDAPVEVKFDGVTYVIPAPMEWDIDVFEYIDTGKMTLAVRSLLGNKQYAEFRKTHAKMRDINGLFEAIAEAEGLTAGE